MATDVECKWCYYGINNTKHNYVLPRELRTMIDYSYYVHRVQLWGIGSEVLKQCGFQGTK